MGARERVRVERGGVFAGGAGRSSPDSEVAQRRSRARERFRVPLERVDHRGGGEGWTPGGFEVGVSNRRVFHQRGSVRQARRGKRSARGAQIPLGAEPRLLRQNRAGLEDGGRVRADRDVALAVHGRCEARGL